MNGIIILAAGNSSRLGRPKQTLKFQNKSLLRSVLDEAIRSAAGPVWVVIGANKDEVAAEIGGAIIPMKLNQEWEEGIASSIRTGLYEMLRVYPSLDAVILTVCDQPFVSASLFKEMLARKKETGKGIIACSYDDTLGTPVLFGKEYFESLQQLQGQEGAKKLIRQNPEDVAAVVFELGSIDIDTIEDLEELNKHVAAGAVENVEPGAAIAAEPGKNVVVVTEQKQEMLAAEPEQGMIAAETKQKAITITYPE
jgi:molybdenum cofactor cytidylyltransferase